MDPERLDQVGTVCEAFPPRGTDHHLAHDLPAARMLGSLGGLVPAPAGTPLLLGGEGRGHVVDPGSGLHDQALLGDPGGDDAMTDFTLEHVDLSCSSAPLQASAGASAALIATQMR